eukprot:Anaeramoba_ignava/a479136_26.p2 GENE.a479136_26~~a479136_26.p2  ORF type:complete len:174 (+),score=15.23 a479136_26:767-1288(+)
MVTAVKGYGTYDIALFLPVNPHLEMVDIFVVFHKIVAPGLPLYKLFVHELFLVKFYEIIADTFMLFFEFFQILIPQKIKKAFIGADYVASVGHDYYIRVCVNDVLYIFSLFFKLFCSVLDFSVKGEVQFLKLGILDPKVLHKKIHYYKEEPENNRRSQYQFKEKPVGVVYIFA